MNGANALDSRRQKDYIDCATSPAEPGYTTSRKPLSGFGLAPPCEAYAELVDVATAKSYLRGGSLVLHSRTNAILSILLALTLALALAIACTQGTPTAAPVPTLTATPVPTVAPQPTAAPTPMPTPTATPAPTATPQPTATPEPTPTATPVPTATPQPTATPVPAPTATPAPTPTPTVKPTPSLKYPGDVPLDAAEIEHWVIVFTNEEREKEGLRPLVHNPEIAAIAKAHSANMAQQETAKTQLDGKNPTARAQAAGYNCGLGENVIKHPRIKRWAERSRGGVVVSGRPTAYDADSKAVAQTLISHWMRSSSGREAILKPGYIQIGVGVTIDLDTKRGWAWETVYAAQDFSSCG